MITKSEAKYIQSLGHKKLRDELKQFVAEGPKIVVDMLNTPGMQLKAIYALPAWWQQKEAIRAKLPVSMAVEVTEQELQRISFLTTPNQVLAIFCQPVPPPEGLDKGFSILLDGIQDPGNFGTIVRIADWFGISRIIASSGSADVYSPKVIQSAMGSIGRVEVAYSDLEAFIQRHANVPVYATALNGTPLSAYGKIKEGMILVGNESKGIQPSLLKAARYKITIPRIGQAESLNAAVATGIVLSHLLG